MPDQNCILNGAMQNVIFHLTAADSLAPGSAKLRCLPGSLKLYPGIRL